MLFDQIALDNIVIAGIIIVGIIIILNEKILLLITRARFTLTLIAFSIIY